MKKLHLLKPDEAPRGDSSYAVLYCSALYCNVMCNVLYCIVREAVCDGAGAAGGGGHGLSLELPHRDASKEDLRSTGSRSEL